MEETKTISYFHAVNSGDMVAALAGIKRIYELTGEKAVIYQQIGRKADYYSGAKHPVLDESGDMVTMNQAQFEMLRPLLLSQEYVEDYRKFTGEKVRVDLDVIRGRVFSGLPTGHISSWIMFAYPDMACDLSKSWVYVYDADFGIVENSEEPHLLPLKDCAILNFTSRYRNDTVTYYFLKEYKDKLVFAGTKKEHEAFKKQWDLEIPRLLVTDFLQLARAIKGAKFFLGNQSMCWNIANAMMHPRIVEVSSIAPNCPPFIGEHNYGFFHQEGLEHYVNLLFKKE